VLAYEKECRINTKIICIPWHTFTEAVIHYTLQWLSTVQLHSVAPTFSQGYWHAGECYKND